MKSFSYAAIITALVAVGCGCLKVCPPDTSIHYHNAQYGFTFSLPASWQGHSVLLQHWEGQTYSAAKDESVVTEHGSGIVLRHPRWKDKDPYQDIHILVEAVKAGRFSIGAGGCEYEIAHNAKYVFGIQSRYNAADAVKGWKEAQDIVERNTGTMTFPSQFMLVAAMNPIPDGKMPGESRCSPREIQNYLNRISGPLLDRIDIHVEVPAVKFREITAERTGETSSQIRDRVVAARRRQQERFAGKRNVTCNARMGTRDLKAFCALDEATLELLKMAMNELKLSARAYDRILKVARTIADLAGSERLTSEHISEAIQYRSLDRQLWA